MKDELEDDRQDEGRAEEILARSPAPQNFGDVRPQKGDMRIPHARPPGPWSADRAAEAYFLDVHPDSCAHPDCAAGRRCTRARSPDPPGHHRGPRSPLDLLVHAPVARRGELAPNHSERVTDISSALPTPAPARPRAGPPHTQSRRRAFVVHAAATATGPHRTGGALGFRRSMHDGLGGAGHTREHPGPRCGRQSWKSLRSDVNLLAQLS